MTTTPSRTSTAIRRACFAGTSLTKRAIWRRRWHAISGLFHFVEQVEFLFSLPRCWQSHASQGRWFFTDISSGMDLVSLHQPEEWFRSQSRRNLCQPAEWFWSQKPICLRQPIELSRSQSRVDIMTLPCMPTRHCQTLSFDVKVRRIWHHIRLRLLMAEITGQADKIHYVWFTISVRSLFWPEKETYVKSSIIVKPFRYFNEINTSNEVVPLSDVN